MMKTQPIALKTPEGVAIMRIVVEGPRSSFDTRSAERHGFVLSEDGSTWSRTLTDEMIVAEIIRSGFSPVGWRRVREEDLPDRAFRNAWKHDLTIDMVKAKEITRERLAREQLRADALKGKPALPSTPQIDNATTLEELLAIKAV